MMNKRLIYLIAPTSLFLVAFGASASIEILNPLGPSVTNVCDLLLKIASGVAMFIAALGTIMIIVAGILFLLSAGSPERINKAKAALFFAIVGIAIGVSATTIVNIIKEIVTATGGTCG